MLYYCTRLALVFLPSTRVTIWREIAAVAQPIVSDDEVCAEGRSHTPFFWIRAIKTIIGENLACVCPNVSNVQVPIRYAFYNLHQSIHKPVCLPLITSRLFLNC